MSLFSKAKRIAPLALVVVLLLAAAGWQVWELRRSSHRLGELRLDLEEARSWTEELQAKLGQLDDEIARMGFVKVDVYFTLMTETAIKVVPVGKVVESGDNLPLSAAKALVEGPGKQADGVYPAVPEGVEVLGVSVKGGIAYADFSEEILGAGFGSEGELAMVSCIVNTLTSLPGIDKVQILVEGKKVESLGGHVLVEMPLSRMDDLMDR
ncbi:MAG: Sporulation and spore germination [Firmicutes bacterium ADurb.Bin153]|nr:MAG: Sporulation and spore germination [Firmicutes bacterium ADurb.Bin153]